ncbi:alpha/beta hydrolase [Natronomonas marina]|jgi:alpha/beta superfamily hydrolase|uniref:alpha/beta hydrolase n=1 Tax=Natronomonas marina TaxID=2961939 RepID=UPI0020C98973|nr:thioesterase domain-containing protein [Natronomonas marina]
MSEEILVPSDRDVRGTLDDPDREACVVACPPHPEHGGSRTDRNLRAVSDAVDCACLRFDYGAWDEGRGELADTRDALAWARDRYESVSLFGYSFGGCLALVAAARESRAGRPPAAVGALAPAARISPDIDAVAAVDDIACPVGVVYGRRDTTVDAAAVAERVRERGGLVEAVGADHFFVGQSAKAAEHLAALLC